MLVPLESSSAVLVMIRSKSLSICNRFHGRWANSGKITISKGGTTLWCPRSRGISSPSGTKLPPKKLDTPGYHMVKTPSLYLTWAWFGTGLWRTDRQTDRIAIANTRSQQYLPVQLWRVKMIGDRDNQYKAGLDLGGRKLLWRIRPIFSFLSINNLLIYDTSVNITYTQKKTEAAVTQAVTCSTYILLVNNYRHNLLV